MEFAFLHSRENIQSFEEATKSLLDNHKTFVVVVVLL